MVNNSFLNLRILFYSLIYKWLYFFIQNKTKKFYVCILDNPKCASSTLRTLYPIIRNKFIILFESTYIYQDKGYSNVNYVHCNLKGAVNFLEYLKIDLEKVTFITTIRHTVEKCISGYFYSKKYFNKEYKSIVFNNYVKSTSHFNNFTPDKFRLYKNIKVNLIKSENLFNEFNNLLNNKLKLSIDCSCLKQKQNVVKRNNKINITNSILDYIYDKYKQDYIDGLYSNKMYITQ